MLISAPEDMTLMLQMSDFAVADNFDELRLNDGDSKYSIPLATFKQDSVVNKGQFCHSYIFTNEKELISCLWELIAQLLLYYCSFHYFVIESSYNFVVPLKYTSTHDDVIKLYRLIAY